MVTAPSDYVLGRAPRAEAELHSLCAEAGDARLRERGAPARGLVGRFLRTSTRGLDKHGVPTNQVRASTA